MPTPDSPDTCYGVLLLSFSRHSHQRNFVPLYTRHPQTRIIAVADDDATIDEDLRHLNQLWADQLGVPYIRIVDEALARADVHIVSVAHDVERRSQLALRSAMAGKHLWIDKFAGATLDEYDHLIEAVDAAGVTAIVPSFAYGSLLRQARAILASGALGQLLGCHVDLHFAKGHPRPLGPQRPFRGADDGHWKYPELKRELLTVGSYSVGLLQACLGPARRVHAAAGAHFFPEHAATGTEDFAALTMVDDQNRLGTLSAGRVGMGSHPAGGASRAWLVGSEATAVIDAKRPAIQSYLRQDVVALQRPPSAKDPMGWATGTAALEPPVDDDPAGLATGLEDFIEALNTGRAPLYSLRDARLNMEILLAGYRSAKTGTEIPLPLTQEGE